MSAPLGIDPVTSSCEDAAASRPGLAPGRLAWQRLWSRRSARISATVLAVLVLVAISAPLLTKLEGASPYQLYPETVDPELAGAPLGRWGGISGAHWFGVEPPFGRDLFARVVYGARTSVLIAAACAVLVALLGTAAGVITGYVGGWVGAVGTRALDTLLAFPQLFLPLALIPVFLSRVDSLGWSGNSARVAVVIVVISLVTFAYLGRLVRSVTIGLCRRDFVLAARALGAGRGYIVFRELLPNVATTIIVYTTVTIPGYISIEAALSFLGVGVKIPVASWGQMIGDAVSWYSTDPVYLLAPGLFLAVMVIAATVFADAVRSAVDPRSGR